MNLIKLVNIYKLIGEADLILSESEFENTTNELYGNKLIKTEKLKIGEFDFRSLKVISERNFANVFIKQGRNRQLVIATGINSK